MIPVNTEVVKKLDGIYFLQSRDDLMAVQKVYGKEMFCHSNFENNC